MGINHLFSLNRKRIILLSDLFEIYAVYSAFIDLAT